MGAPQTASPTLQRALVCHCCPAPTPPSLDPIFSHLPPSTPLAPYPLNHPQAWPVSGSQSKFKLQRSQLLLQPLWDPVIFPCRGGFFCQRPSARRRGLWLCVRGTESEGEEKRGERAAEECTQDRAGLEPSRGAFTTGNYTVPQFGIIQ